MNTKDLKFPLYDPRVRRKFKRAQRKLVKQVMRPAGQGIATHRVAVHMHTFSRRIERTLPMKIPKRVQALFIANRGLPVYAHASGWTAEELDNLRKDLKLS